MEKIEGNTGGQGDCAECKEKGAKIKSLEENIRELEARVNQCYAESAVHLQVREELQNQIKILNNKLEVKENTLDNIDKVDSDLKKLNSKYNLNMKK